MHQLDLEDLVVAVEKAAIEEEEDTETEVAIIPIIDECRIALMVVYITRETKECLGRSRWSVYALLDLTETLIFIDNK